MLKKNLEEYSSKFKHISKNQLERIQDYIDENNFSEKDLKKFDNECKRINEIETETLRMIFYIIPESTPRPRMNFLHGNFYVKNARSNNDFIKILMDREKFLNDYYIYTPCYFQCDMYFPIPSNMSKVDTLLAELGVIRPCNNKDWENLGKTYSDKNHNFYSTVITEYLLTMDERFDSELINKILEVIYFHGKKNKNKDRISLLAKILRDADLFDEECGDSLFYLLISKIKNKKDTLNKLDIVKAKQLLKIKICNEHIEEIESKINTPGGKELYRRLLNETIENFYMFIDYIEGYEEVEDYYNLKYINCLKINID